MAAQDLTTFTLVNPNSLVTGVTASACDWNGQTRDGGATTLSKSISQVQDDFTAQFKYNPITSGGFRDVGLFGLAAGDTNPFLATDSFYVRFYWDGTGLQFYARKRVSGTETSELIVAYSSTAINTDFTIDVTYDHSAGTIDTVITPTDTFFDAASHQFTLNAASFDHLFAFASSSGESTTNEWQGQVSDLDYSPVQVSRTTVFDDDFTGYANGDLDANASWETHNTGTPPKHQVDTEKVKHPNNSQGRINTQVTGQSYADNQWAKVQLDFGTGQINVGLGLRMQAPSANENMYRIVVDNQSGGNIDISIAMYDGGTSSTIAGPKTITKPATPFTIAGEIQGSEIRAFVNDVQELTGTDGANTFTSGVPGLHGFEAPTNFRYDNFESGDLTGGTAGEAGVSPATSVKVGGTLTYTIENFGGALTGADLRDGVPNVLALTSVTDTQAAVPGLADNQQFCLLGSARTLTVTDGTDSATGTTTLNPPDNFARVSLGSSPVTTEEGFLFNYTGTPQANDQVVYPSANLTLFSTGKFLAKESGTYTCYYISSVDGYMESFDVIVAGITSFPTEVFDTDTYSLTIDQEYTIDSVTINGVTQTIDSQSTAGGETTVNLTGVQGDSKFATDVLLVANINGGGSVDQPVDMVVQPGHGYVDVETPIVTSDNSLLSESNLGLGGTGDQIEWDDSPNTSVDSSGEYTQSIQRDFDARLWNSTDKTWGAWTTITPGIVTELVSTRIGQKDKRHFFKGGTGETFTVKLNSQIHRVQISCDNVALENVTVKILPWGSNTQQTWTFEAGTGQMGLIEGYSLSSIEVSGLSEGDYFFTVTQ